MGLSPCAKGCIACGVGSAVIAAIMIPVSILVIAPNLGQHALEVAAMNIPNSTVYDLPDNLHEDHMARIFNSIHLKQTSLPFPATLKSTPMVLHVPASPEGSFFEWESQNLGYFTMPDQHVKHGNNVWNIDETLQVFENTDTFVHWAFMLTLGGFPYGATVYAAGSPKMSAMGIFHMDLKLGKKLNCTYIPPPMTAEREAAKLELSQLSPDSITARRLVGGMGPVTLDCKDAGNMKDDLLDEVLANFTSDLARTTTTTTTTTTTMGDTTQAPATTAAATTAAATTAAPSPGNATTTMV